MAGWVSDQLLKVMRTEVTTQIVRNGWPILGLSVYTPDLEKAAVEAANNQLVTYGVALVRMGNFDVNLSEADEAQLKNLAKDTAYSRLAGGFNRYAAGEMALGAGEGMAKGGGADSGAFLAAGLGVGGQLAGGVAGKARAANPAPSLLPAPGLPEVAPALSAVARRRAAARGRPRRQPSGTVTCASCQADPACRQQVLLVLRGRSATSGRPLQRLRGGQPAAARSAPSAANPWGLSPCTALPAAPKRRRGNASAPPVARPLRLPLQPAAAAPPAPSGRPGQRRPIMTAAEADHLDQPLGLIALLHPLLARAGGGERLRWGGAAVDGAGASVVQGRRPVHFLRRW